MPLWNTSLARLLVVGKRPLNEARFCLVMGKQFLPRHPCLRMLLLQNQRLLDVELLTLAFEKRLVRGIL